MIVENEGQLRDAFLIFHDRHGKYPAFEELSPRMWKACTEVPLLQEKQRDRNRS